MPHVSRAIRIAGVVLGLALVAISPAGSVAAEPIPGIDSGSAGPGAPASPPPVVGLNNYCAVHGAVGLLSNGRTVYCTRVARTDAWVWSYSPDLMPIDPNRRLYTCTDACRLPDGSFVPNYQRCGILCGEPPTSGDIQSGLADCFNSGAPYQDCIARR